MRNTPRHTYARQRGTAMFLAVFLLALAGVGVALSNGVAVMSIDAQSQLAAADVGMGGEDGAEEEIGIEKECTLGTKQRVNAVNEATATGVAVEETAEAQKSQCVVEWCDEFGQCFRIAESQAQEIKSECDADGETSCYKEQLSKVLGDEDASSGFAEHLKRELTENPQSFTQSINSAFEDEIEALEEKQVTLRNLEDELAHFQSNNLCGTNNSNCNDLKQMVDGTKESIKATQERLDSLAAEIQRIEPVGAQDKGNLGIVQESDPNITKTDEGNTFSPDTGDTDDYYEDTTEFSDSYLQGYVELGEQIEADKRVIAEYERQKAAAEEGLPGWLRQSKYGGTVVGDFAAWALGSNDEPEDVQEARERIAENEKLLETDLYYGEDLGNAPSGQPPFQISKELSDRRDRLIKEFQEASQKRTLQQEGAGSFEGTLTPEQARIKRELDAVQSEIDEARGIGTSKVTGEGDDSAAKKDQTNQNIGLEDEYYEEDPTEDTESNPNKKTTTSPLKPTGTGCDPDEVDCSNPYVPPPAREDPGNPGCPGGNCGPTGPGGNDPFGGFNLGNLGKYLGPLSKLFSGFGGGPGGGQPQQNTQAQQQQQDAFCADRYPGTKAVNGRCTCPEGQAFNDGECRGDEDESDTSKILTAEISCSPKAQDDGAPIAISFACRGPEGTTLRADGFEVEDDALSGAASALADLEKIDPLTKIQKFAITCIKDGETETKACEVQVNKAALVVVANPSSVNRGEEAKVGWLSAGAKRCEVRAIGDSDEVTAFNNAHQNVTQINGTATTPPLTEDMEIVVRCETHGGMIQKERAFINVR